MYYQSIAFVKQFIYIYIYIRIQQKYKPIIFDLYMMDFEIFLVLIEVFIPSHNKKIYRKKNL